MIKQLWRKFGPNPFDALLKRAQKNDQRRFLICWNRGLGDIPLGLYALVQRIRHFIPQASVTFVTRSDLGEAFKMLENVNNVNTEQGQDCSFFLAGSCSCKHWPSLTVTLVSNQEVSALRNENRWFLGLSRARWLSRQLEDQHQATISLHILV